MSQLIGADTRRVDAIAEGLHGYSQDVQDLRTMAQRAVIEMRNAWSGGDFEHIAHRWEQEAGPRLAEAASALSTMVVALRAQSAEQRRVSGYAENAGVAGNAMKARFPLRSGPSVGAGAARGDPWLGGGVTSGGGGQPRTNGFDADASLLSVGGGSDNFQYELSVGKVEATADSFAGLDAHGNLVASAGASAAAYLGYAAGGARAGNDLAHVGADGEAYVGAAAAAGASGSIGAGGAAGHLGAEAFAGAKAVVGASGTIAGATAAAGAEISYGIGAHANVDAELSATKVGVAVDLGAALGLGAGFKLDLSVNPQEVIASVDHALAPEPD